MISKRQSVCSDAQSGQTYSRDGNPLAILNRAAPNRKKYQRELPRAEIENDGKSVTTRAKSWFWNAYAVNLFQFSVQGNWQRPDFLVGLPRHKKSAHSRCLLVPQPMSPPPSVYLFVSVRAVNSFPDSPVVAFFEWMGILTSQCQPQRVLPLLLPRISIHPLFPWFFSIFQVIVPIVLNVISIWGKWPSSCWRSLRKPTSNVNRTISLSSFSTSNPPADGRAFAITSSFASTTLSSWNALTSPSQWSNGTRPARSAKW